MQIKDEQLLGYRQRQRSNKSSKGACFVLPSSLPPLTKKNPSTIQTNDKIQVLGKLDYLNFARKEV